MERMVVSATAAATMLSTSPNNVLEWIRSGELPAYRIGTSWCIPVKLLEEFVITKAREETERRKNNEGH